MARLSTIWLLSVFSWLSPAYDRNEQAGFADEMLSNDPYIGAWVSEGEDKGRPVTSILIVTKDFFTIASFLTKDHHFLASSGGSYEMTDNKMSVTISYHSPDPQQVGKKHVLLAKPTSTGYKLMGRDGRVLGDWKRMDEGSPDALAGLWYATSYVNDLGDTVKTSYKVRTIKILSDSYFQWVTFDTVSGKFLSSAGGTYTHTPSRYTENITFYSEADEKTGKDLSFQCVFEGNLWQHSGKSSDGKPLFEIWRRI